MKIIAPTWNDDFELPGVSYSVSDIQDYIEYIIKKNEIFPTNPYIHIYINRINNRLVFKKKDKRQIKARVTDAWKDKVIWYKKKKLIKKTKNGENISSLEVVR